MTSSMMHFQSFASCQWSNFDSNMHCARLEDWKKNALGKINAILDSPLKLKVVNVVGGGDQPWAVLELEADGTCKNGMKYPQRYAWVLRFDEKGIIVQVRHCSHRSVQRSDTDNSVGQSISGFGARSTGGGFELVAEMHSQLQVDCLCSEK